MAQTPSSPSAKAGKQAKKPEKSPAQLSKEIEDAFADVYNSFTTPKRQQLPQKWLEQVGSSYMAYKGGRASGLFVEGPGSGKDNTKYRATLMRMEALKGQITNAKELISKYYPESKTQPKVDLIGNEEVPWRREALVLATAHLPTIQFELEEGS